jgi:hypothetical protein
MLNKLARSINKISNLNFNQAELDENDYSDGGSMDLDN